MWLCVQPLCLAEPVLQEQSHSRWRRQVLSTPTKHFCRLLCTIHMSPACLHNTKGQTLTGCCKVTWSLVLRWQNQAGPHFLASSLSPVHWKPRRVESDNAGYKSNSGNWSLKKTVIMPYHLNKKWGAYPDGRVYESMGEKQ